MTLSVTQAPSNLPSRMEHDSNEERSNIDQKKERKRRTSFSARMQQACNMCIKQKHQVVVFELVSHNDSWNSRFTSE